MADTINRYILRQLLLVTIFVTIALTLAIWLTQSLRLIRLIVNHGMSFSTFLELTLLLLPAFMLIIIPIALFLAVLHTYNRLLTDREIVIMRSVGQSNAGLARAALGLAVVVSAIVLVLAFYMVPASFRKFKDTELAIRNDFSAVLIQQGRFNSLGKNFMIYVRSRDKTGEMRGILVQDRRSAQKPVTMMAERGAIIQSDSGPRVVLVRGSRMELDRQSKRISYLAFERYSFELGALSDAQKTRLYQPAERSLTQLLNPDPTNHYDRHYYKKLIAAGHNRIVTPMLPLAMVMVALIALLYGQFDKRGQAKRIVLAIGAAGAIQGSAIGLHNFAAKVPEAIVLMYANAVLPILIGFVLLLRANRMRPTKGRQIPANYAA
ncbi:MAG: LPS export ABC transporter permease LptF [Alphaproteobacteria bacterium]|nr:LPS export ABC transporter permease LptF [Alphaproteobacteria bacterium]